MHHWREFPNVAALQAEACEVVLHAAQDAIQARGQFLLVLAGGNTPRGVYERLREADADWAKWHVFFGDERCLPIDDAERNSKMASDAWLAHVPIPPQQIHPMPAERGAQVAAQSYSQILTGIGDFDLVLLGLGEDGHTASLFPGHAWDNLSMSPVIAVSEAPKPPADRVSLSASRLSLSRQVVFLVTGEGKRHAVRQWREGIALPACAIQPKKGVDVFLEKACL